MLTRFPFIAIALFCSVADTSGGEKLKPKQIITKAVKAFGGKEAIVKLKSVTLKESGTYYGMGDGLPYTGVYSIQFPNKFRMEIQNVFMQVVNGDKGWVSMMGEVREMSKKELDAKLKEIYAYNVMSLFPFIYPKGYKFKAIAGAKVNSAKTVGLRVSKKDYPNVDLYFDAKTFLLVKATHKMRSAEKEFKEVTQEVFHAKRKKFGNIMFATKARVFQDGKQYLEWEVTEFNPGAKIDPKTFEQPKK